MYHVYSLQIDPCRGKLCGSSNTAAVFVKEPKAKDVVIFPELQQAVWKGSYLLQAAELAPPLLL
jgi:hypothetical protein